MRQSLFRLAVGLGLATVLCATIDTQQIPTPAAPPQPLPVSLKTDSVRIRLFCLKHSKEHMADGDADLAIRAAQAAAAKGLNIENVGNEFVDKNGKMRVLVWEYAYDLPKFKEFVSEQMKIKAEAGDNFLLFTIGHGSPGGHLDNLGQREDVMKALVEAAEENQQHTVWWQLSCHASARLPAISSLTEPQQELFTVVASSTASETSAAGVQGKVMEKVFVAMADKTGIDLDQDGAISAEELKVFLNKEVGRGRGDLVYARGPEEPIFGQGGGLANLIPVVDRNNPQGRYKNYIPTPKAK